MNEPMQKMPEPTPENAKPGWRDRIYPRIKLSVKALDIMIWLLGAAIVGCLVVGTLKGNGVL